MVLTLLGSNFRWSISIKCYSFAISSLWGFQNKSTFCISHNHQPPTTSPHPATLLEPLMVFVVNFNIRLSFLDLFFSFVLYIYFFLLWFADPRATGQHRVYKMLPVFYVSFFIRSCCACFCSRSKVYHHPIQPANRKSNMTLVVGRLWVIFWLGLFAWLSISHDAAESLCLFVFCPWLPLAVWLDLAGHSVFQPFCWLEP